MLEYIKKLRLVVSIMNYIKEWRSKDIDLTKTKDTDILKYGITLHTDYVEEDDKPIYAYKVKNILKIGFGKRVFNLTLPFAIIKPIIDSYTTDAPLGGRDREYRLCNIAYSTLFIRYRNKSIPKDVLNMKWATPDNAYDDVHYKKREYYEELFWSKRTLYKSVLLTLDGRFYKELDLNSDNTVDINRMTERYYAVVPSKGDSNLNKITIEAYRVRDYFKYGTPKTEWLVKWFKKPVIETKLILKTPSGISTITCSMLGIEKNTEIVPETLANYFNIPRDSVSRMIDDRFKEVGEIK